MVLPYDNMDYGEDQVGARNIPELNDVELTNLTNGEILKYNTTTGKWENQPDNVGGAGTLDGLTDTNINSLQNEQYLRYNSSSGNWENFTLTITDNDTDNLVDLTDTNISSVANTEVLKYNSTSSNWENAPVLINEIGDINITSLQNGEVLKYNSSSGKWENQDNTDTLNELTDVTLTGSSNNQVLKYNGSFWVNNFVNLTELADTNLPSLNNGDILRYNSVSQKWETDTFNIDDLDNVNITGVANNEVLKYNSVTSKWENSNRIDTLDELGDVTLTSVTTGDLLRYNGSIFVNTKIAFDNDFTNVNFTSLTNGDLIKYDGSNFINFSPTYLDGAGIDDNYLIKVVSGATTQTSFVETSVANTSTSLQTFIPFGILSVLAGSIETEMFNTNKTRMHLTSKGINGSGGITITSDGRVGIGVVEPEEDLELDGNIQLNTGGVQRGRIIFYDKQNDHEHAEIDGLGEGTNGGVLAFYTKVDGGSVTEKLRINNGGNVGIGTITPTHRLEVNGDIKGDNLFLGSDGQTPKIDMFFIDHPNGPAWDTKIEIGKSDDITNSPAFPPNNAYGMNVQTNSDGLFVGVETYDGGSNWRPLLKWGDDSTDTPFRILSHSGNHSYEFGTDGKYKISGNEFRVNDILHIRYSNSAYEIQPNLGNSGSFNSAGRLVLNQYNASLRVLNSSYAEITSISPYKDGIIYHRGNFYNVSDDRLKSYETDVSNATSLVMKMNPKFYIKHPTLITDDPEPDLSDVLHFNEYGFIAQELNEDPQLSHFVRENPNDNIYHVNYVEMIPLLVQTIKELNERIRVLENAS